MLLKFEALILQLYTYHRSLLLIFIREISYILLDFDLMIFELMNINFHARFNLIGNGNEIMEEIALFIFSSVCSYWPWHCLYAEYFSFWENREKILLKNYCIIYILVVLSYDKEHFWICDRKISTESKVTCLHFPIWKIEILQLGSYIPILLKRI